MIERLQKAAFKKCIPITVTFEITLRCNLRCVHCYNFDRTRPLPKGRELEPEEIRGIIDQLREAGCLYLTFTGGEALAHPRIFEFVSYAAGRNCVVGVKTNGTTLDDETARMLAEAGAARVDISLYGGTAATHDAFTRVPGSFDRTLRGAQTALQLGLEPRFSFCLVKTNAAEIDLMIGHAKRLGLPYSIDPQITARYDGTRDSMDLRIDRATLEALYRGPLRDVLPEPDCRPERSVQCACARSVCGISAYGDVYPCIGAPIPAGNLRRQSFAEIWRTSGVLNWIRGLKLSDFATCKPCPDRGFCRRSSGVVYTNTGQYTGAEEWTCMEANVLHKLHDEGVRPAQRGDDKLQRHTFTAE